MDKSRENEKPGVVGHPAGPVLIACIVAVVVATAVMLAMVIDRELSRLLLGASHTERIHVPNVLVVAALALACILVVGRPLKMLGKRFGSTIALVGLATAAPVFAYHARRSLDHAISSGSIYGLDYLEIEVVAPWAAFCALLGCGVMWALSRSLPIATVARVLRVAAGIALGVGSIAIVFGAARSAKGRPDAAHFVESLPIVYTMTPIAAPTDQTSANVESDSGEGKSIPFTLHDSFVDTIVIRRSCDESVRDCRIQAFRAPPLDQELERHHGWSVYGLHRGGTIRRDADHGMFVVESNLGSRLWLDAKTAEYAYPVLDRSSIAPPRRWVFGGLAGLIVALIAIAWRPAAARRATRLAHAREGHSDGKRITFEDGTPPFEPSAAGELRVGPVLVLPTVEAKQGSAFRDLGGIQSAEIFEGTHADARVEASAAWCTRAALVIAAIAIPCAPLLVG